MLIFSLAALLAFDTIDSEDEETVYGKRPNGDLYPIREDRKVLGALQAETPEDVARVLADESLWGADLSDLSEAVYAHLSAIREDPRAAVEALLNA